MKWPQVIAVLLGVLAVALAVRLRENQQRAAAATAPVTLAVPPDPRRALPPSFERPELVSRQIGLLRAYVALAPEIPPATTAAGAEAPRRVEAAPLLVVLENETYLPLKGTALGWTGPHLCLVRITRETTDAAESEIFLGEIPLPGRTDWLSAERRSFTLDWPLAGLEPGEYRIAVQLMLPDLPVIELRRRVR